MESDGVVPIRPDFGSSFESVASTRNSVILDERLISPNAALRSAATEVRAAHFRGSEREESITGLLDAFPHLVWTTDAHGSAEYYNLGWLQFTGRSENDLLGRGMFEVIHPDDRDDVIGAWKSALTRHEAYNAKVRILRHDGCYRMCSVRANPVFAADGSVERWIGTTTDIHDQQELQVERLRLLEQNLKQREHLHRIIDNVPGIVWEAWGSLFDTAASGRQQADFVSPHVEKMLGYSQEEWLSTPNFWLSIVHPEDRDMAASTARRIYESAAGQLSDGQGTNHFRWITKSGRTIWIEAHCSVLFDENGQPAGMCGVSIDITERHLAEQQHTELATRVEEERARFQRIINAVPGIVWEISPSLDAASLLFVSDQAESIIGYSGDDLRKDNQGKELPGLDLMSASESARFIGLLRGLGKEREAKFDMTLRHAAGHTITLESHVILTGEGEHERLSGVSFDVTADRILAKAAERGEHLLHAIAQNVPALLCYVDKDERYRFSNLAHQQWWNKSADEIIGRTVREVAGDATYSTIGSYYSRALAGEELHFVLRIARDGRVHHFDTSFIPQYEANEVSGLILLAQDVTERVHAEQSLKQSEERLRAIADNSPSMLWLSDDRGMRFFFNVRWFEFTGSEPEENLGDGWQAFIDSRDLQRFLSAYGNALATHSEFQIEYRLLHVSGEERWVLCQAKPRFSDEGKFLGLIGSCTDISVQKHAEIAILRSHEHFRQLAEGMPHIIWAARADGTGEYWNRYWFDYTGLTEEQCQRPVLRDGVFHVDDLKDAIRVWKDGIAAGTSIEFAIRIRRASDGMYRWHLARTVPVHDASGTLINWVGSVIDIHDQKMIHDELRDARDAADAANRAKDHFLATLSHELRTPLTPVLATIETLELDEHLPAPIEPHIATIRRNVELEARLIDDLLDLTRITRGKIHLSKRSVELHGLLANVLEICRQDITVKRLDVHLGLHAQHTHLNADPARLQQILWNVLQNAVKFTGSEGRISLKTSNIEDPSSGGKRLRIEIADSGIGIEPNRLDQIFRPFEQGNVAITKQFGGLGLGLAITKMLVDMHEGSISAMSEGDGQGSTFVLEFSVVEPVGIGPESRLPLPSATSKHSAAERTKSYPKNAGENQPKRKILLVDDHADTSASIRILLERRGYAVTVADTMKNAIAAFAKDEFDLVISDIGLPDGSGWELIEKIRERSSVHAIAVSGFCTEQDIERSKNAGFDVHLTKPFNFNDLHREIQSLILQTATP